MNVVYDPEADLLRILFSSARIEESDEDKSGGIIDYDQAGNIVSMEIPSASKHMETPRSVEVEYASTS